MQKIMIVALLALTLSSVSAVYDGNIKGVSLGGHLVPEPFIDAIFWNNINQYCPESKDIWNLCECTVQNPEAAIEVQKLMQDHLSNFVDVDELEKMIHQTGINSIRYPISFTYFLRPFQDPKNYYKYKSCGLDMEGLKASNYREVFEVLKRNQVDVLLDFHQGVGCQNGFDNGGHFGVKDFFTEEAVAGTIQVWRNLMDWVKHEKLEEYIWAYEVLNEPVPWMTNSTESDINQAFLKNFTETVVNDVLAPQIRPQQMVVLQPGPGNSLIGIYSAYDFKLADSRILLDFHEYTVFGGLSLVVIETLFPGVTGFASNSFGSTRFKYFIGEWSLATTDCAQYLDGACGGYTADYYNNLHVIHNNFYCNKIDQYRSNTVVGFQSCSGISNNTETFPQCQLTEDFSTQFEGYKIVLCELFQTWTTGFASNSQNVGYYFWTYQTGEKGVRQIHQWDFTWLVEQGIVSNLQDWKCPSKSSLAAIAE